MNKELKFYKPVKTFYILTFSYKIRHLILNLKRLKCNTNVKFI